MKRQDAAAAPLDVRGSERGMRRTETRDADRSQHIFGFVEGIIPWEADAATLRFTFVGAQALHILGYPLEEWTTDGFWALHVHPEDRDEALAYCLGCTQALCNHEFEYRMIAADGRVVWIRDLVTVVKEDDGTVQLRGVMVDITAQKRLEAESQLIERRFRGMFHSDMFGAMLWKGRGEIIDANDALLKLVGYTRDELERGMLDWSRLTPPEFHGADSLALDEMRQPGSSKTYQKEFLHKSGRRIPILFGASLLDESGTGAAFVLDVSEQRRAEEALRATTRAAEAAGVAKMQFLANMSHEIRTPMNGLLGMLELVSEGVLSSEQRELVGYARASAESLLGILNDVLDYSKIESGHLELQPAEVRLRDRLEVGVEPYRNVAHKKGLSFEVHVEPSVPDLVTTDPLRLQQVVSNLLDNAIKFTEAPGSVRVHVKQLAQPCSLGMLVVSVEDTGIGVPAHMREAIFDSFVQADSSTTRQFGGTGLGLAICAQLVRLLGGHIWVESVPGGGSRFSFTAAIDLSLRSRIEVGRNRADAPHQGLAPVEQHAGTILLVEDNLVNQRVALHILRRQGFELLIASNGLEALARVNEAAESGRRIDLILMDCQMPELDGFAATSLIRAQEARAGRPRVPIIALTAYALTGDRERCLEAGMNDYLSKPFGKDELEGIVRKHLPRKR